MIKYTELIEGLDKQQILQLLFAIFVIIAFRVLSSLISKIIIKILRAKNKENKNNKDITKNPFYLPLKTIFSFIGIYIALNMVKETLQINPGILTIVTKIVKILMILLVAKAFGQSLDEKNEIVIKLKNKNGNEIDQSTIKIILRTIKIIIYVIAIFMVISELGYDIGGFITGLGLGGVVLTLAAQDTAKSLIGGVAIFIDKPFKVGDYIKVGQHEGTVEEIKFRSTSIRTLENSVLHVPNSEMSISSIINYSEMTKRRFYTELVLSLNTKLEDLQQVEKRIKNMLNTNELIIKDSINISFQSIINNGMNIMVMAYINETNYFEFLKIKEEINYEIINILRSCNVELAYNTQTIYVKK